MYNIFRDDDFVDSSTSISSQKNDNLDSRSGSDLQVSPLDLTADVGNNETIDLLKNWVTDCMERERSPSPEFIKTHEEITENEAESLQKAQQPLNSSQIDTKQTNIGKMFQQGYIPTLDEIKEGRIQF